MPRHCLILTSTECSSYSSYSFLLFLLLPITHNMPDHEPEPKRFEPKVPVQLDPPKDDPISVEELSKCDGTSQPHEFYLLSTR